MKISTSSQVWHAIHRANSDDLHVSSSYSAPDGDMFGDPSICRMETEYTLKGADMPLMCAKTTWDKPEHGSSNRPNEKHEYWLIVNTNNED